MNKCILLAQLDTGKRLLSEFGSNVLIGILQESCTHGQHRGWVLPSGQSLLSGQAEQCPESMSPGTSLTTPALHLPGLSPIHLCSTSMNTKSCVTPVRILSPLLGLQIFPCPVGLWGYSGLACSRRMIGLFLVFGCDEQAYNTCVQVFVWTYVFISLG